VFTTVIHPLGRRIVVGAVTLAAALVSLGSPGDAGAVAQETASVSCGNNGRMEVYLPHDITTSRRNELVHVRVDLFEWRNGAWRLDLRGNRWYTNIATSSGEIYGSWWIQSSTGGVRATGFFQHGFTINGAGFYRAALRIVWERSGRRAYEFVDQHILDDGWGGLFSQPAKFCTYE
jgi:hypothetical protein